MKNLFFRGAVRIGKSTCLRSALNQRHDTLAGICVQRMLAPEGIIGYRLQVVCGGPLPPVDIPYDSGLEGIFFERGEKRPLVMEQALTDLAEFLSRETVSLLVLDEIGGFELAVPHICQLLEEIFAKGIPCVGILKDWRSLFRPDGPAGGMDLSEEYQWLVGQIEQDGQIFDVTAHNTEDIGGVINRLLPESA